ncbi:MAG: methyltransferase domain-containing protein, partial [Candidatus Aenigmarchaeota archaeon]|nr:methyltransferase domain-containing protein [Candidatus Aenigmarchaeota archaeon]
MKKILELGSGKKPYLGKKDEKVIHLDIVKLPHVEIVHDLNKFPWPFKDNEFDEIRADNVIEHLDDLVKVMEEIWRILKPKGIVKVWVPYFAHPNAFTDITHKHFFTLHSFDYFDQRTEIGKKYSHEVVKINFK